MAKFKKGETPPGAIPFSEGIAKEMQARSAQARRTNRTLREVLREALDEEAAPGMTRLEALARKALANHYNGKLTMKDLKDLSAVLGEQTINVKTDGIVNISVGSPEVADALDKVLKAGAQPRDPETE